MNSPAKLNFDLVSVQLQAAPGTALGSVLRRKGHDR
jgi:hypothetical protein